MRIDRIVPLLLALWFIPLSAQSGCNEVFAESANSSHHDPMITAREQLESVRRFIPEFNGSTGEAKFQKYLRPQATVEFDFPLPLDSGGSETVYYVRSMHQRSADLPSRGGWKWTGKTLSDGSTLLSDGLKKEVMRLSFIMSSKIGIAGLPFGGGKGGTLLERSVSAYTAGEREYITRQTVDTLFKKFPGVINPRIDAWAPDVGTGEVTMKFVLDQYLYRQAEKISDFRLRERLTRFVANLDEKTLAGYESDKKLQATPVLDEYMLGLQQFTDAKAKELAMVTGKNVHYGGAAGRNNATGWGGYVAIRELVRYLPAAFGKTIGSLGKPLHGLSFALQGFGEVGSWFAYFVARAGGHIKFITAMNNDGSFAILENPQGIEKIDELIEYRNSRGTFEGFAYKSGGNGALSIKILRRKDAGAESLAQFVRADVDVIVPAATNDQITDQNAGQIRAKVVHELGNAPTDADADKILEEKGIIVTADALANQGGVIASAHEYWQNVNLKIQDYWNEEQVLKKVEETMQKSFARVFAVYQKYKDQKITLRKAALIVGLIENLEKFPEEK